MAALRDTLGRVLAVVLVISVPPALLLGNLYILISPAYLRHEYGKAGFPPAPRLSNTQRYRVAETCVRFLRTRAGVESLRALEGTDGPLFNERELRHMEDVKRVTRTAFLLHRVSVLLVLGAALVLSRVAPQGDVALRIAQGAGLTILLVGLVLVAASASFSWFFTAFHRVFFAGDTWLFPYTDALIQLFPIRFWVDTVQLWVLAAIAESCLLGGLTLAWLKLWLRPR